MIANFIRSNFHDFGVPNHFPQGLYNDFDQCDIITHGSCKTGIALSLVLLGCNFGSISKLHLDTVTNNSH